MTFLCFALGLAGLFAASLRLYGLRLLTGPAGPTAGGAATRADLCRRGTPPDVAAACLAEEARSVRIAELSALFWGGLGVALLLSGGQSWRSARPRTKEQL